MTSTTTPLFKKMILCVVCGLIFGRAAIRMVSFVALPTFHHSKCVLKKRNLKLAFLSDVELNVLKMILTQIYDFISATYFLLASSAKTGFCKRTKKRVLFNNNKTTAECIKTCQLGQNKIKWFDALKLVSLNRF